MSGDVHHSEEIALLSSDLMIRTKVAECATQLGVRLAKYRASTDITNCRAVIVDLDLRDEEPCEAIAALRARFPAHPIIAFGSHVDAAKLQSATKNGATRSLPRSKFSSTLVELLKTLDTNCL